MKATGIVGRAQACVLLVAAFAMTGATMGCSTLGSIKETFLGGPATGTEAAKRLSGFIGGVVSDEPRATLAAREVLALGGNAADAAVGLAMTLAVTLPSRAGLGSGGGCIAYNPKTDGPGQGNPEAIMFLPVGAGVTTGADRPAAVPMLARGMFALHARYGRQSFESLVAPAEQLARFGTPVSRALLRDLAVVAGPLAADPNARAVFAPGGVPLAEGSILTQGDLGGTLAQIRTVGVGDLYQGALARRLETAARVAGGGITVADMRAALPRTGGPLVSRVGRDSVAFLPTEGGTAAAALLANPGDTAGAARRALPASTGFAVLDRDGNSVACTLTMNNLFGTGRVAPGTGILLAASPAAGAQPLLAAAIVWNGNVKGFRAAVTGTGQEGAALGAAVALTNALRSGSAMPSAVPEPGRANVIQCARYLPDSEGSCSAAVDPRGFGLSAGSN